MRCDNCGYDEDEYDAIYCEVRDYKGECFECPEQCDDYLRSHEAQCDPGNPEPGGPF
jgi:hypothetical protein